MDNRLAVLIVGAGPTGLMMACQLARYGIAFRIIDKKPERTLTSNAAAIQPRTLEVLQSVGIVNRFIKLGNRCHGLNLYANDKRILTISLNYLDSIYPFILTLPQSETERLLNQYLEELNGSVERPLELIDIQQTDDGMVSTVQNFDEKTETIVSNWVVACDGANSTVRQKCHIQFPGEDLPEQFMVADAEMDSFLSSDEVHIFLGNGTVFGAFPFGEKQYRVAANLHQSHPRKFFTEKEVKDVVNERTYGNYNVDSVSWISPFWIHGKIVNNMRLGSVFLAGDAAHIHSPMGAQGMNTGLQDAYNLAWKLALVIQNKAKLSLLDSYQLERHPIVMQIVNQTERLTKVMVPGSRFLLKLLCSIARVFPGQKYLSKKIGMLISQLGIRYRSSPIIDYHQKLNTKSPKPGERAPDVVINQFARLYDYLHHSQHNVLLFAGLSARPNDLSDLQALKQWLNQTYPGLIKVHIITREQHDITNDLILDPGAIIHKRYGVKNASLFIIRPDNYIGYVSNQLDRAAIASFLDTYLL